MNVPAGSGYTRAVLDERIAGANTLSQALMSLQVPSEWLESWRITAEEAQLFNMMGPIRFQVQQYPVSLMT